MNNFSRTFSSMNETVAAHHPNYTIETPIGKIFLRDHCSAALIESLRADKGLRAFARRPEREHQLLLSLARRDDSKVTIAYTPGGEIIGQVSLVPVDGWWQALLDDLTVPSYEIGIEVSSRWRGLGVARHLADLALASDELEESIILAMGLSWHWDTEELGMTPFRFRNMLIRYAQTYGFAEYQTSEQNISSDPANFLLARIGKRVGVQDINQFITLILRSDTLPGLL